MKIPCCKKNSLKIDARLCHRLPCFQAGEVTMLPSTWQVSATWSVLFSLQLDPCSLTNSSCRASQDPYTKWQASASVFLTRLLRRLSFRIHTRTDGVIIRTMAKGSCFSYGYMNYILVNLWHMSRFFMFFHSPFLQKDDAGFAPGDSRPQIATNELSS